MPPEDFRQQIHFRSIVRLEQFTPMCPKRNSIMKKEGVQKGKIPPCRIGYLISVSNRDTNKSRVPNTFWTPSFLFKVDKSTP